MKKENKYIVSGFGFLSGYVKDDCFPYHKAIWVKSLYEAKGYTSKQATSIISKIGVDCFIWNITKQIKEEPKYRVVRRQSFYDGFNEVSHEVLEWIVVKNYIDKNDYNLIVGEYKQDELYDEETALKIAKERNTKILEEITHILNK